MNVLSALLSWLLIYVVRYRRKVVQRNLERSFPEKCEEEIRSIIKEFYKYFSAFLVETLKLLTLSLEEGEKHIRLNPKSLEEVNQKAREGKSIVVLSGHNFNWEYWSLFPPQLSHKMLVAYKPLKNNFWQKVIKNMRERHGAIVLNYKMMYLKVIRLQKEGIPTICWLGLDQRPRSKKQSILNVNFLNQPTTFLKNIDSMTRKMGSHIYFQEMRKVAKWQYEVNFRLITDRSQEEQEGYILSKYVEYLEELIHKNPANWLWSHKRWK